MPNELNLRLIRTAEQMIPTLDKMHEITQKLEADNASRMVWFVAISGFAILNIPKVMPEKSLASASDFIPWLVTAVFGVIAHWFHRNVAIQNFSLYLVKRENLLTYVLNGPDEAIFTELEKILTNKTDNLTKISGSHRRATDFAARFEQLTFLSFLVSLVAFVLNFTR